METRPGSRGHSSNSSPHHRARRHHRLEYPKGSRTFVDAPARVGESVQTLLFPGAVCRSYSSSSSVTPAVASFASLAPLVCCEAGYSISLDDEKRLTVLYLVAG